MGEFLYFVWLVIIFATGNRIANDVRELVLREKGSRGEIMSHDCSLRELERAGLDAFSLYTTNYYYHNHKFNDVRVIPIYCNLADRHFYRMAGNRCKKYDLVIAMSSVRTMECPVTVFMMNANDEPIVEVLPFSQQWGTPRVGTTVRDYLELKKLETMPPVVVDFTYNEHGDQVKYHIRHCFNETCVRHPLFERLTYDFEETETTRKYPNNIYLHTSIPIKAIKLVPPIAPQTTYQLFVFSNQHLWIAMCFCAMCGLIWFVERIVGNRISFWKIVILWFPGLSTDIGSRRTILIALIYLESFMLITLLCSELTVDETVVLRDDPSKHVQLCAIGTPYDTSYYLHPLAGPIRRASTPGMTKQSEKFLNTEEIERFLAGEVNVHRKRVSFRFYSAIYSTGYLAEISDMATLSRKDKTLALLFSNKAVCVAPVGRSQLAMQVWRRGLYAKDAGPLEVTRFVYYWQTRNRDQVSKQAVAFKEWLKKLLSLVSEHGIFIGFQASKVVPAQTDESRMEAGEDSGKIEVFHERFKQKYAKYFRVAMSSAEEIPVTFQFAVQVLKLNFPMLLLAIVSLVLEFSLVDLVQFIQPPEPIEQEAPPRDPSLGSGEKRALILRTLVRIQIERNRLEKLKPRKPPDDLNEADNTAGPRINEIEVSRDDPPIP